MNRTVDALIIPYARRRTLELVLSLSGYEADKDAYLEAKGILERAVAALDDGRDPADNIERIDGQLVELRKEKKMDFTNGFYKTENPVILEEVKTFLQSMERRGATVKDLDDAIVQLNNVSHSISTNALVKADVLDDLPNNPFRSMLNGMLQSKR
jgi:hypothetical protein